MVGVQSYRDLIAWQKAMDLVAAVYTATERLPVDERFGLSSQIRRAAVSIPSNIAEGQGRSSANEFQRFLSIARGSLHELETQVILAERLAYVSEIERDALLQRADEVGRVLRGLSRSVTVKQSTR